MQTLEVHFIESAPERIKPKLKIEGFEFCANPDGTIDVSKLNEHVDSWMILTGDELVSLERTGYIRTGGLARIKFGPKSLPVIRQFVAAVNQQEVA